MAFSNHTARKWVRLLAPPFPKAPHGRTPMLTPIMRWGAAPTPSPPPFPRWALRFLQLQGPFHCPSPCCCSPYPCVGALFFLGGGSPLFPLSVSHTQHSLSSLRTPTSPAHPTAPTPERSGRDPSAHLLLFGRLPHRCGFASLRVPPPPPPFYFLPDFLVILGSLWVFLFPFFSRAGTFLPGSDQRCYVLSAVGFFLPLSIFYIYFLLFFFPFFPPFEASPHSPPPRTPIPMFTLFPIGPISMPGPVVLIDTAL